MQRPPRNGGTSILFLPELICFCQAMFWNRVPREIVISLGRRRQSINRALRNCELRPEEMRRLELAYEYALRLLPWLIGMIPSQT